MGIKRVLTWPMPPEAPRTTAPVSLEPFERDCPRTSLDHDDGLKSESSGSIGMKTDEEEGKGKVGGKREI